MYNSIASSRYGGCLTPPKVILSSQHARWIRVFLTSHNPPQGLFACYAKCTHLLTRTIQTKEVRDVARGALCTQYDFLLPSSKWIRRNAFRNSCPHGSAKTGLSPSCICSICHECVLDLLWIRCGFVVCNLSYDLHQRFTANRIRGGVLSTSSIIVSPSGTVVLVIVLTSG